MDRSYLIMRTSHVLPRLSWFMVALLVVLSVLAAPLFSSSNAHAAAGASLKLNPMNFFYARPMWNGASKAGSSNKIPPCLNESTLPRCYSPQQLRNAYGIQPLIDKGITGKGHSIVIIDGSSSPTLSADLHLYD